MVAPWRRFSLSCRSTRSRREWTDVIQGEILIKERERKERSIINMGSFGGFGYIWIIYRFVGFGWIEEDGVTNYQEITSGRFSFLIHKRG